MATSMLDITHWARAVMCAPSSTTVTMTMNQAAPTTVTSAVLPARTGSNSASVSAAGR